MGPESRLQKLLVEGVGRKIDVKIPSVMIQTSNKKISPDTIVVATKASSPKLNLDMTNRLPFSRAVEG